MPNRTTEIPDSLIEAYREIQEKFPEADVELGMDIAVKEYYIEPSIDVEVDIDDLDDWQEKEEEIEKIVREYEGEDEMIYTFVDRKRHNDE